MIEIKPPKKPLAVMEKQTRARYRKRRLKKVLGGLKTAGKVGASAGVVLGRLGKATFNTLAEAGVRQEKRARKSRKGLKKRVKKLRKKAKSVDPYTFQGFGGL